MKLAGAAQGLAGAHLGAAFARVVDEHDGDVVTALEVAQVCEQRRNFAGEVLVDEMKADKRIEDEEPGLKLGDGRGEAV